MNDTYIYMEYYRSNVGKLRGNIWLYLMVYMFLLNYYHEFYLNCIYI